MKKVMLALVMVIAAAVAVSAKNAYEIYNEGYDLYIVHDYKEAVKMFKKAIKMQPTFVKPYDKAGLSYVAMKQVDHAIFYYKKAIHIQPTYAEAYYNLGVAYELKYKDDTSKAEESYIKAIDIDNDRYASVRSALNLSNIYRKQKKYDDAILLMRNAVKYEEDFAPLYNSAGLCYLETGLYDEAVKSFEKALSVQQRYPEASVNLGLAFQAKGQLARAIAQFEETIKKDPEFAGAHYNYANALILNGFYEKAEEHLKKALRIQPVFPEAYYSLGKACMYQNKFDEANESYKKALEQKKDYALAKQAKDELKQKRLEFRSHITFPKKKTGDEAEAGDEGAEEEQVDENGEPIKKPTPGFVEDVEDLRLPDDEKKKVNEEGEEVSEEESGDEGGETAAEPTPAAAAPVKEKNADLNKI